MKTQPAAHLKPEFARAIRGTTDSGGEGEVRGVTGSWD
jgi:hypothetical protein